MEKIILLLTATTLFSWGSNQTTLKADKNHPSGNSSEITHKTSIVHFLFCRKKSCYFE